jgi:hypothetical protein
MSKSIMMNGDSYLPQAGIGKNRKWEIFVNGIDPLQLG